MASELTLQQRWLVLAMGLVMGVVLFDESAVAIALPDLRHNLGLTPVQATWVISAYLLTLSACVAACGRIADLVGLRRAALAGCALFGAMSALAAMSTGFAWLITARVLQGLGAAIAFPVTSAVLRGTLPLPALGQALGYLGLASSLGLTAGPLLGGVLTGLFGWRAVFLASLPVVLLAIALILRHLPPSAPGRRAGPLDRPGLALLLLAVGSLVAALMQGPAWGWRSPRTLALAVTGAAAAALFLRRERRTGNPLIELDLFAAPSFGTANLMTLLAQFAKTPVVIYGPLLLIDRLGFSPSAAGLALLPGAVAAMPAGPGIGRLSDRTGARAPLLTCLLLVVLALAWLGITQPLGSYPWLLPGLIVWGVANTGVFVCSRRGVQASAPADKAGQASGINATAQWLGAALSVPALGVFVVRTPPGFTALFLAAALVLALALAAAWRGFERP
ncbi:MAG: MFS transporter [Cyanobacteria bacterium J06638_7]